MQRVPRHHVTSIQFNLKKKTYRRHMKRTSSVQQSILLTERHRRQCFFLFKNIHISYCNNAIEYIRILTICRNRNNKT